MVEVLYKFSQAVLHGAVETGASLGAPRIGNLMIYPSISMRINVEEVSLSSSCLFLPSLTLSGP